jgi:ATP synthase F1 delta subunit
LLTRSEHQQYTAAVKNSSLDTVAKAIGALNEVYSKDPKLATILQAPTLSSEDKSQIISELQKHTAGADKDATVKNFLATLAEYNRLGLLKGVCEKFGELMSAAKGEVELTVTSAAVSIARFEFRLLPIITLKLTIFQYRLSTAKPSPVSKPQSLSRHTSGKERSSRSPTKYVFSPPPLFTSS